MKKTLLTVTAAAVASLIMQSCLKESEYHTTQLIYPYAARALVYADQAEDSIVFTSTESWRLVSEQTWCTFPDGYGTLDNPYANTLIQTSVPLTFQTNTTGEWRSVDINIRADEYSTAARYYQSPYHHILSPGFSYNENGFPDKVNSVQDSALVTTDSITFEVYESWTLTAKDGSWLQPANNQGGRGVSVVRLALMANPTGEERHDTLLLRSSGITTAIPVVQLPNPLIK